MKPDSGRHLSFPFQIGSDGRSARVTTLEQHIGGELMQLVLTDLGERVFLPEFGANIRKLVFQGAEDATLSLTKASLTQALNKWLGHRIVLENVELELKNEELELSIVYRIAGTADSRIMRFQRGKS